jgi:hypothetical protein
MMNHLIKIVIVKLIERLRLEETAGVGLLELIPQGRHQIGSGR